MISLWSRSREFDSERERERERDESYLLPDTMECLRITSCDSLRSSANTNFQATLRLLPLNVFPTLYDAFRQKVIKKIIKKQMTYDLQSHMTAYALYSIVVLTIVRIDI